VRALVRESPHVRPAPPPTLYCSTGAYRIPVGPFAWPTIPSSHLGPWGRSGVGGGRRDRVEASPFHAKMSSSGSGEVAPASVDHVGDHGRPPGTSPAPVGRLIPDVALSVSKAGDAPPKRLPASAMLVRLYRVVVGVVPAPPKDVNTAQRFQLYLAMRPDLETSWFRGQRREFLTRLETTALVSSDHGAGEVVQSAPGVTPEADPAPCAPGSAWATRLACLSDCLIRDPALHYDSIISAPVIRASVEDEYPGWLAATLYRVKSLAAPLAYPNLLYMPIPGRTCVGSPSCPRRRMPTPRNGRVAGAS